MSEPTWIDNPTDEQRISLIRGALSALGTAYRLDWSNFDGRSLRSELDGIDRYFKSERIPTLETWMVGEGIDPETGTWR